MNKLVATLCSLLLSTTIACASDDQEQRPTHLKIIAGKKNNDKLSEMPEGIEYLSQFTTLTAVDVDTEDLEDLEKIQSLFSMLSKHTNLHDLKIEFNIPLLNPKSSDVDEILLEKLEQLALALPNFSSLLALDMNLNMINRLNTTINTVSESVRFGKMAKVLASNLPPKLEKLSLGWNLSFPTKHLQSMISDLPFTLRKLNLRHHCVDNSMLEILSQFTNLEALELRYFEQRKILNPEPTKPNYTMLGSTIFSLPNLQELSLHLDPNRESPFPYPLYSNFKELTEKLPRDLKRLKIYYHAVLNECLTPDGSAFLALPGKLEVLSLNSILPKHNINNSEPLESPFDALTQVLSPNLRELAIKNPLSHICLQGERSNLNDYLISKFPTSLQKLTLHACWITKSRASAVGKALNNYLPNLETLLLSDSLLMDSAQILIKEMRSNTTLTKLDIKFPTREDITPLIDEVKNCLEENLTLQMVTFSLLGEQIPVSLVQLERNRKRNQTLTRLADHQVYPTVFL
ncbi:MAG: hypothetical protein J0H12_02615 [Candidatus Paracaedimonas acanthamoebae]|uniref:Uncharacterized protein n=1 Tax=Candidatus Paracaedimonas acanthamoebae TaxID=244581 RepID=A0A8J7TU41_9PROT|nr:hypothetical protein [Candidatus Paracaedimonas acanthamoebae]